MNKEIFCKNCGHPTHCKKKLERLEQERTNNEDIYKWKIEVCKKCSCSKCKGK
jgi:hypothetical protein